MLCHIFLTGFIQSATDLFEDTKGVIFEEREDLLSVEGGSTKTKVIDNATNMTEVDMSFEIEDIEVKISQVC